MNPAIEIYTVFLDCILIYYFSHKTLEIEHNYFAKNLLIHIACLLFLLFSTLYIPAVFRPVLLGVFLYFSYHFILSQPTLKTLYTIVLFLVAAIISDLFSGFILTQLGVSSGEILGISIGRFLYNTISKIIHLLFLILIFTTTQKNYKSQSLIHAIPLVLCNIVSIVILYFQFLVFIENQQAFPLITSTLGMLIINIVLCIYTEVIKHTYSLREKQQRLEIQLNIQEHHYEDILARQKESRSLWHDIKKYMLAMETLITEGQTSEASQQYFELQKKFEILNGTVSTGNPMVDGILNYEYNLARLSQINITQEIWISESLNIPASDFYVIVGNTFDNAIEACSAIPEYNARTISISLHQKNHSLIYEISNPIPASPIKKDRKLHGYGLENVKECVKRNKGVFSLSTENNVFHISIVLKVDSIVSAD